MVERINFKVGYYGKQGGNKPSGNAFANFANQSTQANNYDDALKAKGLM